MDNKNTKPKGTFAKLMQSTPLPPQQTPVQPVIEKVEKPIEEEKNEAKPQENKKLLGARITPKQYAIFKNLYLKLNSNDSNIDKGEVVGIAIETLAELLEGNTDDFPTVNKLKSYLVNKLTKLEES